VGGTITALKKLFLHNGHGYATGVNQIATGEALSSSISPSSLHRRGHITRQVKEVKGLEKGRISWERMQIFLSRLPSKAAGEAADRMYHSSPDFSAFAGVYKSFLDKHPEELRRKNHRSFPCMAYDGAMIIFLPAMRRWP